MAVAYKGGKCALCEYDKCIDALCFHHTGGKKFGISAKGYTRSWKKVQAELDECILVCPNCYTEIHVGLHDLAALFGNE